jgi:NADPH:quinone reductase-like Zn-dependent oxidoreductase
VHAAVLHTLGRPTSYAEHADPQPGAGVSLVRVSAAPLVPLDLLCASGTSSFGPPALPYVPGVQGVGVVEQSDSLAVGTRVWFAASAGMAAGDGSLAELAAVTADDLVAAQRVNRDPRLHEQLTERGATSHGDHRHLPSRRRRQPRREP